MGGWGSGSYLRTSGKTKTEDSLPLDIRMLKRKGLIFPGGWISSKWSSRGNVYASITADVHEDCLVLKYWYRKTEDVEQRIYFTWTPCNYGGQRIWFVCPYCCRRCAVIYSGGKYFACRKCCRLTYRTCNETPRDRIFTKAEKLREKIEAEPGSLNPLPWLKPKGMHQKTWDRIRHEIERLEDVGWASMGRSLGISGY
jgi:hypothetical protein